MSVLPGFVLSLAVLAFISDGADMARPMCGKSRYLMTRRVGRFHFGINVSYRKRYRFMFFM